MDCDGIKLKKSNNSQQFDKIIFREYSTVQSHSGIINGKCLAAKKESVQWRHNFIKMKI